MQPVWDNDGKPIASLFYTYYKRNLSKDSETKESHRPIIISFNGGLDLVSCGCISVIQGQEF